MAKRTDKVTDVQFIGFKFYILINISHYSKLSSKLYVYCIPFPNPQKEVNAS